MKFYRHLMLLFLTGTVTAGLTNAQPRPSKPHRSIAPPTSVAVWSQYGFAASHSSYNNLERTLTSANVSSLSLKWAGEVGASRPAAPVVGQGMVYAMADGTILAFQDGGGGLAWSKQSCSGTGTVEAALGSQALFVGDTGGGLGAFDPASGNQIWCQSEGGSITAAPAVDGSNVFITNGASVIAADQASGTTQWTFTPSDHSPVTNTPAIENGVVFATGGSSVFALAETSGQLLWRTNLSAQVNISAPAVSAGIVYVGGGNLYALRAADGSSLWTQSSVDVNVSIPAVADNKVFVTSQDPQFGLWAFNASTGAFLWRNRQSGESGATPCVANGVVYEISDFANLMMFSASSGALLGTISDPNGHPFNNFFRLQAAVVNGTVYVSTNDYSGVNQVDAFALP